MSVSGQEPTPKRNSTPVGTPRQAGERGGEPRDIIPVPLIIGIFVTVLIVTTWLLHSNWTVDMTRYRSGRAQQKGDYEAAVKHLNKLIEIGEESGDALAAKSPTYFSELAYSYRQLEDYDNALKYYLVAQENRANMGTDDQGNPRPPADFKAQIGYVYFKMGNPEKAREALEDALDHDRLNALANYTLGEIAMQQNEFVRAADYFKVVANHPTYQEQVKKYYGEIEERLFAGI